MGHEEQSQSPQFTGEFWSLPVAQLSFHRGADRQVSAQIEALQSGERKGPEGEEKKKRRQKIMDSISVVQT